MAARSDGRAELMVHRTPALLRGAGLAIAVASMALLVWVAAHRATPGPIYTVTQIVDGAIRHPKDWDGRIVRVEAIASVSLLTVFRAGAQPARAIPQILLVTAPDRRHLPLGQDGMIRLLPGREDRVLALLRGMPLIGMVATPPQRVSVTHSATYQIQIHLAAHDCNFSPCIAAILLDAAPLGDPTAGLPYGL